jgi:hypothetical protein
MKDLRGISASAVRTAIFKEFGIQIPNIRKKSRIVDISTWKKSKEVKECYNKLYDDEENSIEDIVNQAFPTITRKNESKFNDIYVYTAAICDIILNPDYPDLECAKKPLENRFRKFKVIFFLLKL